MEVKFCTFFIRLNSRLSIFVFGSGAKDARKYSRLSIYHCFEIYHSPIINELYYLFRSLFPFWAMNLVLFLLLFFLLDFWFIFENF
jgi:hypothetical protein